MKILITNDDGVYAAGIRALAKAFCDEHEVFVVAPDSERSGASHSITLTTPLRVKQVELSDLPGVPTFAVNGTPVDCVKIACGNLGVTPDVVLSGINLGANLGSDVHYSGTVSAAMAAAAEGVPAIAGSVCASKPKNFAPVIQAIKAMIPAALEGACGVININAPDLPMEEVKGYRFTASSHQKYELAYVEREDPHRQKYYWVPAGKLTRCEPDEDTDERWVQEGYIAIVPLKLDLTDYACLQAWKEKKAE
ncbi:MAG: 5'/3'-nucleotidase SurE [Clostridia bacterium]|nr:5'/3'-nucleotidase SurE [Clostridia bacterium]